MAYQAIDRRRFTYLLSLGADDHELRNFFLECRVQLIQRGARVQNLPHGGKARIRVIANELPSAADDVIRAWFAEHLTMSDPEKPEAIVENFRLYEELSEVIEEATARRLARSCLVHLFSDSPNETLIGFLRSSIPGSEKVIDPSKNDGGTIKNSGIAPKGIESVATNLISVEDVAQMLVALIRGQDVDKHLGNLPADFSGFMAGLYAASKGRFEEAGKAIDQLPISSAARESLEEFVRQQEVRPLSDVQGGINIIDAEVFTDNFDVESDEMVGYCTKSDPPKSVFVQPIAVLRGGVVRTLSGDTRRSLFPANGDVMAFLGATYPKQPKRGELGVWKVEEHQTDKATHFHLKADARKLFEAFNVPFPSTDYDSVREYLKDFSGPGRTLSLQSALFVLSDGLIVGARPDRSDLTKDDAFESGLLSWNSLPGVRLEGRMFITGPLPKTQALYECASIGYAIRKLLRPFIGTEKSLAGLTRSQLSELSKYFESDEIGLTQTRIQRIRVELKKTAQSQEAMEALVQEIFAHPSIVSRVATLVNEAADRKILEKSQLQTEISKLQNDRNEWDGRIRKQKEEHKKLRDETAKVVKSAFERARTDGVGLLAELAVFQELGATLSKAEPSYTGPVNFVPEIREFGRIDVDPISIARNSSIGPRKASALMAVGKLVFSSGLILCVKGMVSRRVVEQWSQTLGKGILVDATIGLVDDTSLRAFMGGVNKPEVIAMLDANLSPLDIYARPIVDMAIEILLGGEQHDLRKEIPILLSLSDSVGSLPVPKSIEKISINVDLDKTYEFDFNDLENLMSKVFDEESGVLSNRLWAPALGRVKAYMSNLDNDTKSLILPILLSN